MSRSLRHRSFSHCAEALSSLLDRQRQDDHVVPHPWSRPPESLTRTDSSCPRASGLLTGGRSGPTPHHLYYRATLPGLGIGTKHRPPAPGSLPMSPDGSSKRATVGFSAARRQTHKPRWRSRESNGVHAEKLAQSMNGGQIDYSPRHEWRTPNTDVTTELSPTGSINRGATNSSHKST